MVVSVSRLQNKLLKNEKRTLSFLEKKIDTFLEESFGCGKTPTYVLPVPLGEDLKQKLTGQYLEAGWHVEVTYNVDYITGYALRFKPQSLYDN